MQLQYMDILTSKLLDYLHTRLKKFVAHDFVAKWQDKVQTLLTHTYILSLFILQLESMCI